MNSILSLQLQRNSKRYIMEASSKLSSFTRSLKVEISFFRIASTRAGSKVVSIEWGSSSEQRQFRRQGEKSRGHIGLEQLSLHLRAKFSSFSGFQPLFLIKNKRWRMIKKVLEIYWRWIGWSIGRSEKSFDNSFSLFLLWTFTLRWFVDFSIIFSSYFLKGCFLNQKSESQSMLRSTSIRFSPKMHSRSTHLDGREVFLHQTKPRRT